MISENEFGKFSLYIGDLDSSVTEDDLYNEFNTISEVTSVKICRDPNTGSSLGYAYVNFNHSSHAEKAKEALNFVEVKEKPMRIMLSKRDPSMRKSGKGNVFVKNLDSSIDNKQLFDIFSTLGTVVSCKVARDTCGASKGHGFVQFNSESSVKEAMIHLNGAYVRNQYLHVCPFVSRRQWDESPVFTNVYVKNLSEITETDADLRRIFEEFGKITSAVVMRDGDGKSRRFGFVNFEKSESAATAIEKMNGIVVDGKELYVGRAQRKKTRVEDLRAKLNLEKIKRDVRLLKGMNLYVKNIEDSVTNEKLGELFSEFGTITSCKVMVHPNGMSKGFGFVEFSTSEEASKAVLKMNGKMVGRKPIYVSLAQRKEERRLNLETQFNTVRPDNVVSPTPSPHQHPIFSQAAAPFRGYPFQPQLISGSRLPNGFPTVPIHVPNFMVPQQFPFQRPPLYSAPPPPLHWLQPMTSLPQCHFNP